MALMSGRAAPGHPGHPQQGDSREGEDIILEGSRVEEEDSRLEEEASRVEEVTAQVDNRAGEAIAQQDSKVEGEASRSEEVTAPVDNRAGEATAQRASREGEVTAREILTWTPRLPREISSQETSTPAPTLSQEDGVRTGQELRSPG